MQRNNLLAAQQHALFVQLTQAGHLGGYLLLKCLIGFIQGVFHQLATALFLGGFQGIFRGSQPALGGSQRR